MRLHSVIAAVSPRGHSYAPTPPIHRKRPGGRALAALTALAALSWLFAASPTADAGLAGPSEKPPISCGETETGQWPEPEALFKSATSEGACLIQGVGGLTITPKVVRAGEPITASMPEVAKAEEHQEAKWGWQGFVQEVGGGHVVSGCGEKAASCKVKASANAAPPSDTWEVFSHAVSYGGIFAGTSYSSDYFYIVPRPSCSLHAAAARASSASGLAHTAGAGCYDIKLETDSGSLEVKSGFSKQPGPPTSPVFIEEAEEGLTRLGFTKECRSECLNIRITITKGGRKADNMPVAISVTRPPPETDDVVTTFGGSICAVSPSTPSDCGNYVKTRTDKDGQVYLRYWAPGIVDINPSVWSPTLTVVPDGKTEDQHSQEIEVDANKIYTHDYRIDPGAACEQQALGIWASNSALLTPEQWSCLEGPFKRTYPAVAKALEKLPSALRATKLSELDELVMIAWFMDRFDIHDSGMFNIQASQIGSAIVEKIIEKLPAHQIAEYVYQNWVKPGTAAGETIEMLKKLAPEIAGQTLPVKLTLTVFEVSYCSARTCANNQPAGGASDRTFFELTGKDKYGSELYAQFKQEMEYEADDWFRAQF